METEKDLSLPFLDVLVERRNNMFIMSVFEKLGIRFFSFCTKSFKSNNILSLLNRAFNICFNYKLIYQELQFLTFFFHM